MILASERRMDLVQLQIMVKLNLSWESWLMKMSNDQKGFATHSSWKRFFAALSTARSSRHAFSTHLFVACLEHVQFGITQLFYIHHLIAGRINRMNQFIELKIDGSGVPVLGILNEKYHEKRDDSGSGIDHQLPRVGIMKEGPGCRPNQNNGSSSCESPFGAEPDRRPRGELTKAVSAIFSDGGHGRQA
jgi:hypothetical protein